MNSEKNIANFSIPKSVNLHITERCNYRCSFCFAKYNLKYKTLTETEWKQIIDELIISGCEKINFAGGEPTLIPFLSELISYSHEQGVFTSLISNGTGITSNFLQRCNENLDLIGLSIDSASNKIETELGRTFKSGLYNSDRNNSHVEMIKNRVKLIKEFDISLKINTTITPLNWQEDMHDLLTELSPIRWKVFEVHLIHGINDSFGKKFGNLTTAQFGTFIYTHADLNPIIETKDIIKESYCMITPDGRFYQNSEDEYYYSLPILSNGLKNSFSEINYSQKMFCLRNGDFYTTIKNNRERNKGEL